MKYRLLDILICPECSTLLTLESENTQDAESKIDESLINNPHCKSYCGFKGEPVSAVKEYDCPACFKEEIYDGTLVCGECFARYSIIESIPRMTRAENSGDSQVKNRFEFQWETWGGEEKIFGRTQQQNTEYILAGYSKLRENDYFKGKLVLDGGCGHGRYLYSFATLGAEVVGLDFGSGIDIAAKFNRTNGLVHTVQGDLLNIPLRNDWFDYTFSTGVIHHTPDPRKAFDNLANITRPGGALFVWVYPREGLAWEVSQKALRMLTTRLPARLLFYLCYILVPLLSVVGTYSSTSLKSASWRQCAQVIYDWFSPEYQYHFSEEEISDWFSENKFTDQEKFYIRAGIAGVKTNK